MEIVRAEPTQPTGLRAVPRSIWALGFVSMLMDISSEMIHSLLPVFLVSALGASTLLVGIIEGVAEATASITKVFSGTLSDYLGKRKFLTVLGYSLGALSKPLFALASSVPLVFTARFLDRIGKGIRGAPRDALIGDIAPPHLRGACYGLRQSLDTVGAFAGPLLAVVLMALTANDFRAVFWIAVIPGIGAVLILVVGVEEPGRTRQEHARSPISAADFWRLGRAYWSVVLVAAVLTLARFSEAFLVLRAQDVGLPTVLLPFVLVTMNVVYAASAYPFGGISDRMDRRGLIALGFGVLIAADGALAVSNIWAVMGGIALWGLHMGMTQGLFAALIADSTPTELRGTAFGVFNLASGMAMLLASVIAGFSWEQYGAPATFLIGAALTLVGLLGGILFGRR